MMKKMSIKQGDKVIVLNGKDKGKTGEVLTAMPREGKVVVQGVNVCSRHTKPASPATRAASSRRNAPFTPARSCACAPSVKNPPVRPTSCWPTAKKFASARSAALKSERKERIYYACFEG